jgi:hypothetical protein
LSSAKNKRPDVKADYYENNRIVRDQTLQRLTEERSAELRKRAAVGKK